MEREPKIVKWNLAKEGGWDRYKEVSDQYSEAIEKVINNEEDNVEEAMKKFNKIHDKIKFISFGKATVREKSKINQDEKSTDDLVEEQEKRAAEEIEQIKKVKGGRVGQIWDLKKKIVGGKKATMKANAIIDPKTKTLVVAKKQIQEVSLKYCQDTLKNNEPEKDYIEKKG